MSARFASEREPAFGTTLHIDSNGRNFRVCIVTLIQRNS